MTALPAWPAVSGAATFQQIRRALAGQFARDTSGVLRKGVLPASLAPLVVGSASMNVSVGAFVALLDRNGALLLANDGAVNVLLSPAPGSGSRWSVVYVKQRETDEADAVNGPIIDRVESTSSEGAARALLPAGALELAVVKVDAGSATTLAVGVTITDTFRWTSMTGGMVPLRSQADQDAWTPHDGSRAYRLDTGDTMLRRGGAWKLWHRPVTAYTPTLAGFAVGGGGTLVGRYTVTEGVVEFWADAILGTGFTATGAFTVTVPITASTDVLVAGVFVALGTARHAGVVGFDTANRVWMLRPDNNFISNSTWTWASGNRVSLHGSYLLP